ncbi:hypothetical protein [Streptomyces beigongshangae]|uniref:hypothetical protein n=1 Tax=Streptomyces beigongshangae TaxID=2841597 RepID=UPI001C8638A9|nr:hypothetical protein [Streptomyces sp. REN17]
MPARHVTPALIAGGTTGLVLLLRWTATRLTRREGRRYDASSARAPWRRTAPGAEPLAESFSVDERAALEEAEKHVHRYWKLLHDQLPPGK